MDYLEENFGDTTHTISLYGNQSSSNGAIRSNQPIAGKLLQPFREQKQLSEMLEIMRESSQSVIAEQSPMYSTQPMGARDPDADPEADPREVQPEMWQDLQLPDFAKFMTPATVK